jgi:methyl-accepting chemotaxis protein
MASTAKSFRFTIGRRIYVLIMLASLGLLGVTVMDSRGLVSGLRNQKQIELKHLADLALSIVKQEHAAQAAGVDEAEAKQRAARRLAAVRYGNNDYFFVIDNNIRVVMHPIQPKLDGTDVSGSKDPNGKQLFVEMADAVKRSGEGYVDYQWAKPGADKPSPKLSYVVGFAPWGWIVGTGVYIDDLEAQTSEATGRSLIAAAIVLLLTLGVSVWMARGITNPIQQMTAAMKQLASGRTEIDVPGIGRSDEIGEMADAVEVFKTNAVARQRLEAEQKQNEAQAVAQRKADTNRLADEFENAISKIIETVSSSSRELEASAGTLTGTAARSQQLAIGVSTASQEASGNVQSVASATEEMTSSVHEISRQVQESASIADEAVDQARRTNDRVGDLSEAAARIGDVVELINTIAGQTNLLALNATIEAARAGEAGRGFAVVASEVKALAEQTAKATGEIGQQISGIQAATQESVSAIREISETIARMAEIAATVASAVEEQGAATQEIARNVQLAAHGTTQVSTNIGEVRRGASDTEAASSEVLSAARSLSRDSERLRVEVHRFLETVRAA